MTPTSEELEKLLNLNKDIKVWCGLVEKVRDSECIAAVNPEMIQYLVKSALATQGLIEALLSIPKEIDKLADVHLNGSGNLTKEQKSNSHDTCLVVSGWIENMVIKNALAEYRKATGEKND